MTADEREGNPRHRGGQHGEAAAEERDENDEREVI
jgi:hypothetical protein